MALEKEFQYYREHQQELVDKHNGKFIVIKNDKVIGVFDSQLEAYTQTKKEHQLGTFLIQRVSPGTDGYTQVFHSRVSHLS